jgi:hypothetical protein
MVYPSPRRLVNSLLILICCHAGAVSAGMITLDTVDEGKVYWEEFTASGVPPFLNSWEVFSVSGSLQSMYGGYYESPPEGTGEIQVQGWVIFDLSAVIFDVFSATLELGLASSGHSLSTLSVNTLDAYTPSEISALATSPHTNAEAENLYDDISSGPLLGSASLANGSHSYDVGLNASAISLLNQTTGLIAFGLSHPDGSYHIDFSSSPRLVLQEASTMVPLPGTLWLVLLVLPFIRYRRS